MKKNIKLGYTNKKKVIENNNLIIEKTYTGFNHKIDYKVLNIFNFVPNLIDNNQKKITWKLIEGKILKKPSHKDLKKLAINMRILHKSKIKLPKNNLRQRVNAYIKIIHEKYLKIKEVDLYWKKMNNLITKMNKINPCHNDFWWSNIIKDKNGKIWLVDWEYATMGDKHFDLAYYIESQELSKEEEKIFLNAYNSLDKYSAYIKEWMDIYKMFVNWLTLIWAHAQDELPFPTKKLRKKINYLANINNKN